MRGLVNFCDYFVISAGTSDRHVKSIAQGIREDLTTLGINAHTAKNSKDFGVWVLLDLGNVVVHVFEPQAREFYGLEHLWQDAPKVKIRNSKSKTRNNS